jgi:SRSO17 transposase
MQTMTPPKENIDNNTLERIHICSMCSARGSVQECDMDEESPEWYKEAERRREKNTVITSKMIKL